jgi:hypothetical protein
MVPFRFSANHTRHDSLPAHHQQFSKSSGTSRQFATVHAQDSSRENQYTDNNSLSVSCVPQLKKILEKLKY